MTNKIKSFTFNITFISAYLLTLIIVCSIFGVIYFADIEKDKEEMSSFARSTGFELYKNISSRTNDLYILEEYIKDKDGDISESIKDVCALIYNNNDDLQSVSVAPNGIVKYFYPYEGNELLIDFNFNSDISHNSKAQKAVQEGRAYMVGPYTTIQGVEAIIIRHPVYLKNNEYWGMVSIALKYPDAIYNSASMFKELDNSERLYKVTKTDSETGRETLIFESGKPVSDKYVSINYQQEVFDSVWNITISRATVWYQETTFIVALILGIFVPIMVAYLYRTYRINKIKLINQQLTEQKITIKKQEEEVKQNKDLIGILASEYAALYVVHLDTDQFETSALSPYMQERFGDIFANLHEYIPAIKLYIDNFVDDASKQKMYEATTKENIYRELKDKKSFTRSFTNKQGLYCEMKFVKTEDIFDTPHIVALGFAEKNEAISQDKRIKQDLRSAKEKAEEASNAKSTFLFNMSHDIRTPMNAIIGFTNMAKKHINDKECVEDCLSKVESSSEHLLSLINDILDMSRIESGNIELEYTPVDIEVAAKKVVDLNNANALKKSIKLDLDMHIEHNFVYADELRVNRVITNIIGNAIKYTKPGGRVIYTINETKINDNGYYGYDFIVADTGIGISEEFIDHIFDSFSREKNSTVSGVQGTGLGMTITKQLVDMMRGTIKIKSKLDVGTTVTMHFDFKPANSELIEKEATYINEDILFGKKVLLVEDNELNRDIANDILADVQIIVDEATDGAEAVEIIKNANDANAYDFILMDIQMPYMDGYEATRQIRALPIDGIENLPIIAMTANAFEEDKKKAYEAGMNAHISKPIDIPTLFKTLIDFID